MRVSAVLAGFFVDTFCSFFFFSVLAAIVGGDSPEDTAARMTSSIELQVSTLLVGLAFTAIGGYVAATIARGRHVQHAAAVGVLSLMLGLLFVAAEPSGGAGSLLLWLDLAALVLTIPAAVFGGWYREQTDRQAQK